MAKKILKAVAGAVAHVEEGASKPQMWALFLYTRKDWRTSGITKAQASEMLSDLAFESECDSLRKGKVVLVKFEADAKRLFEALKSDDTLPEAKCDLSREGWRFTPMGAVANGFPTRK